MQRSWLAVFLVTTLLSPGLAIAADPPPVHQYRGLALSPNGDRVAAVEADEPYDVDAEARGVIVVRDRKSGAVENRFDSCATCFYDGLSWSPDGTTLAFVASDRKTRTASLHVIRHGADTTVTPFNGLLSTPRWSPDGKTLAVLATDHPAKQTGATQAGAAQVGEIGTATDEQRIAIVAADGGTLRMISPADTFIYEYDWMPNGAGFVASEAKGDGDNNWWIAKVASVRLADGSLTALAAPDVQIRFPRVSPDGKTVTFIGGLMSDFGPSGGDLYTVPIEGGSASDRTPQFKGSFSSLMWRGRSLFATALVGDQTTVMTVDPATGAVHTLLASPRSFSAGDGRVAISSDGRTLAAVVDDYGTAPAILAGTANALRAVTHDNDALQSLVSSKSITWKNEGFDVQGWLVGPRQTIAGKTYPMIVEVHGGPSAAAQPSYLWKGTVADFVNHGYFVFMPNPRGSFGQGEAFARANIRDFGGGDLRDILAGITATEAVAPIDEKRLGIYGHSYGGFMTMWTVTQSQRFKAAVAGAGLSDWMSYYGENGIDEWMIPFFGASVYDDPAIYDKLSPIRYIKAAKTPTFIYVGERDVECPAPQSIEFWHGLEAMGVPNSLVIYEGEGHAIRQREHREDLRKRILAWFDHYLGAM